VVIVVVGVVVGVSVVEVNVSEIVVVVRVVVVVVVRVVVVLVPGELVMALSVDVYADFFCTLSFHSSGESYDGKVLSTHEFWIYVVRDGSPRPQLRMRTLSLTPQTVMPTHFGVFMQALVTVA
jgi:hypothetical protein